MIPKRAAGADLVCTFCDGRMNAVIALASSVLPEGWFVHTVRNPETGAIAQLNVCPRCKPAFAAEMARRGKIAP